MKRYTLLLALLASCQTQKAPTPTSLRAVAESKPGAALTSAPTPASQPKELLSEDLDGDGVIDTVALEGTKLSSGSASFHVGPQKQLSDGPKMRVIDIEARDNNKEVLVYSECVALATADALNEPCGYFLFSYQDKALSQVANPLGGDDFIQCYEMFSYITGDGRLSLYREDCGTSRELVFRLKKAKLVVERDLTRKVNNTDCR